MKNMFDRILGKNKGRAMKKQEKFETSVIPPKTGPDIAAFMFRIEQKLAFIEKKMDLLIGQTPSKSFEANLPVSSVLQTVPQHLSPEVQRVSGPGASHGHSRGRREKTLHKTVCADCQKDCEVPFKPTGERPVYCKECFSSRKASRPVKAPAAQLPEAIPPAAIIEASAPAGIERKVTVTKKGVGKVTVSEIARPGTRETSSKCKPQRPAPARKFPK
jgi:CxxC-x17-CxxC domain-containing protein